jgi:hypothetical protein
MNSKQTILDRELFTQALRHMGEEDLLYLNRMVVERLNLLAQAKSTVELAQFAEGDRVQFTASDGSIKYGIQCQGQLGGCQRCGSSSSMRRALCVGNRVSTSLRYA